MSRTAPKTYGIRTVIRGERFWEARPSTDIQSLETFSPELANWTIAAGFTNHLTEAQFDTLVLDVWDRIYNDDKLLSRADTFKSIINMMAERAAK